jgi:hypothetical protein
MDELQALLHRLGSARPGLANGQQEVVGAGPQPMLGGDGDDERRAAAPGRCQRGHEGVDEGRLFQLAEGDIQGLHHQAPRPHRAHHREWDTDVQGSLSSRIW